MIGCIADAVDRLRRRLISWFTRANIIRCAMETNWGMLEATTTNLAIIILYPLGRFETWLCGVMNIFRLPAIKWFQPLNPRIMISSMACVACSTDAA